MTGDLGDEATEGGGFVVFGQAKGGGIVAGVASVDEFEAFLTAFRRRS